jgi:hypothetical protein
MRFVTEPEGTKTAGRPGDILSPQNCTKDHLEFNDPDIKANIVESVHPPLSRCKAQGSTHSWV